MNCISLSKSKFCKAKQCNKILWLDKNKPEEAIPIGNEAILENGTKVGELARNYFGEYSNIEFNNDLKKMIYDTKLQLKNVPNIITEASFEFDNNFCSIDILKNDIDGIEIYEVKSSTSIHAIYLDDVSYQYYVLHNLGFNIKSVHIMYINNEYVRNGDLELEKLFNIEDVTEIAISKQNEIKEKIKEINEYMQKYDNVEKEPKKSINMNCFNPYDCAYWNYCTKDLPENNIFKIRLMHKDKKVKLYNEGKITFENLIYEDINEKYLEQIDFELNKKETKIEKEKIREFLNTLSYPLYFLDFETFQQVIPEYDGVSPYMQIPFQYSLHYIEKENGELKHKDFLAEAGIDPRRKLAERLVADIPKNVCVTAYNMSFEKSVIKKLAETYPDLSEHLLNIRENIKDLMIPFKERHYYCRAMQGSYSIKYVLPALFPYNPELDYHKLPVVHNGGEASFAYSDLVNHTKEEQERIRKGLLLYCGLDTLAMVKVWEKLKEVEGEVKNGK